MTELKRVEIRVRADILDKWDRLCFVIGVNRTSLILVAMQTYLKNNKTMFKLQTPLDAELLRPFEEELERLKEEEQVKEQVKLRVNGEISEIKERVRRHRAKENLGEKNLSLEGKINGN